MSIVRMKRIRVLALAEERSELLSKLMSLGCVEISEPEEELSDPEWTELVGRDTSELSQVRAKSSELENALSALRKYAPVKTGLFQLRGMISERELFSPEKEAEALESARAINASVRTITQAETQENRLQAQKASLLPWKTLDLPLETDSTDNVEILPGTLPQTSPLDTVRGELARAAELAELIPVSEDKEQQYVLLLCHKSQWVQAQEALKPYTFIAARFKDLTGTAAENITAIDAQLAQNAADKEAEIQRIRDNSGCRENLQLVTDRLNQDAAKEQAREQSLTDGTIVFLEGWVPAPKADKVEQLLKSFDAAYSFRDPQEGDSVPTLLQNPKWMKGINMVTEMFSLPAYNGIDPNPLIFGWYVLFFGFMFADVAYGLIIFAVCLFITKKYRPKNTMGYMFSLGQWLGISTAICGFFVGGFFGNAIDVVFENFVPGGTAAMPGWLSTFTAGIIVNPVNDPMTVLIIAIVVGCVHLVMGQCIHIYMEVRDGHPLEGILDVVPWWLFFAGIGALVLAGSPVVIILSVIVLVATQGRHNRGIIGKLFGGISSLYDVTSWLSDVLSYARLMALMLATSVIAQVFNTLGALPHLLIVFIIVFIIGHGFNIGVNLIGTYVHAARLQYLEYFNKFYISGGIPFKPLKYNTKFVDVIEEEK